MSLRKTKQQQHKPQKNVRSNRRKATYPAFFGINVPINSSFPEPNTQNQQKKWGYEQRRATRMLPLAGCNDIPPLYARIRRKKKRAKEMIAFCSSFFCTCTSAYTRTSLSYHFSMLSTYIYVNVCVGINEL